MEIDSSTIIGIVTLASGAIVVGGTWVISVEKRINGLKGLQRTVDRVDRRTELMSLRLIGHDVGRPEEGV